MMQDTPHEGRQLLQHDFAEEARILALEEDRDLGTLSSVWCSPEMPLLALRVPHFSYTRTAVSDFNQS